MKERNLHFSYLNIKTYFHRHNYYPKGISYVGCTKCTAVWIDPRKNAELQVTILDRL